MTSTLWLLLGLTIFCVLCLFAIFIGHCINTEWRRTDEPVYRTADAKTIRQQTSRIITATISHASARRDTCCCDLATARREGTAAALRDGVAAWRDHPPPSANPYPHNALAHVAWRRAYQRAGTDTNQQGAA